jgi:hypothetical protein
MFYTFESNEIFYSETFKLKVQYFLSNCNVKTTNILWATLFTIVLLLNILEVKKCVKDWSGNPIWGTKKDCNVKPGRRQRPNPYNKPGSW